MHPEPVMVGHVVTVTDETCVGVGRHSKRAGKVSWCPTVQLRGWLGKDLQAETARPLARRRRRVPDCAGDGQRELRAPLHMPSQM